MTSKATERGPWTPARDAYAYTRDLSPFGWAWEFLRRNPTFRDAALAYRDKDRRSGVRSLVSCVQGDGTRWIGARCGIIEAESWGLLFFPNPDLNGVRTTPFWTPELTGGELEAIVQPRRAVGCGLISLSEVPGRKTVLVRSDERVRMMIESAGYVEILGAETPNEPPVGDVEVALALGKLSQIDAGIERIEAFVKFCRSPSEYAAKARESRVRRLTKILVALDGKLANHTLREIAHAFHPHDQITDDWNGAGVIKARVRRLAERGETLMQGCYRSLVAPRLARC